MSFISFAQNYEDVLLWRVLQHVPQGFYIDVGANDPELHSVTKAFYDHGWHGINIEPMPSYGPTFQAQRPRDINLNAAAGASSGSITLYDIPAINGWASTDAAVAARHRAHGHQVVEHQVPLLTLADICRQHVQGPVHFLKIDVEGFEADVLRGMDFELCRPWIVVVEAIMPNSQDSNHEQWEALITAHRYQFAWFDGLNRYYVADEQQALLAPLQCQPNVFDDYLSHHLDKAWQRGKALDQQLAQTTKQAQAADQRSQQLKQDVERSQQQNNQLEQQLHQAAEQAQARAQELEHALDYGAQLELEVRRRDQLLSECQRQLEQLASQAQHDLQQAASRAQALEQNLHQSAAWGSDLERRLLAVYASSSWRITAPLRWLLRRGEHSLPQQARRAALDALRRSVRWLTSRELLRRALLPLLLRSPRLNALVSRSLLVIKQGGGPAAGAADVPHLLRELPCSARKVLADLQQAHHTHTE
ncbi:FkbM family methyltransferase [Pseudoduganella danionis]|uniref:FkbM family methyltransferase n=1 Tax=Pseudoduganella danionis TaxID=1890295 RepID=A0ABW9SHW9_9BURK|nr:FkbM family methyltransferase [Pseudoduganella danionis]MTW31676.1 FkbM family methyltransferase [Pseudoduganella danionis]